MLKKMSLFFFSPINNSPLSLVTSHFNCNHCSDQKHEIESFSGASTYSVCMSLSMICMQNTLLFYFLECTSQLLNILYIPNKVRYLFLFPCSFSAIYYGTLVKAVQQKHLKKKNSHKVDIISLHRQKLLIIMGHIFITNKSLLPISLKLTVSFKIHQMYHNISYQTE